MTGEINQSGSELYSGKWTGYYAHFNSQEKYCMSLSLLFNERRITGNGEDDKGCFTVSGRYDLKTKWCGFKKRYKALGVSFTGYIDRDSIWGVWKVNKRREGSLIIWPGSYDRPGMVDDQVERDCIPDEFVVYEVAEFPEREKNLSIYNATNKDQTNLPIRVATCVVASPPYISVYRNVRKLRTLGYDILFGTALEEGVKVKGVHKDSEFGSPKDRAREFERLADERPDIVIAATGGWGTVRMLSYLNDSVWDNLKHSVIVGFSDVTPLLNVAASKGIKAFHGPCMEDPEVVQAMDFYTLKTREIKIKVKDVAGTIDSVNGRIWGGNLTTFGYVAHEIKVNEGDVLFIEDIFEPDYYGKRCSELVDWELARLERHGIFERISLLLIGDFTGVEYRKLKRVIAKYWKGPLVRIPVGHGDGEKKFNLLPPIPIGQKSTVSVKNNCLVIKN